jgi:AcrR family transcriptional regulator
MPYPSQVTREPLIEMAWQMIEEEGGPEQVSLAALAKKFGVKAPSLYRHVKNKTELLREVNLITWKRLTDCLLEAAAAVDGDPKAHILALGEAYRNYVHQFPITYQLAYTTTHEIQPDPAALEAMAIPLQRVMASIAGDDEALTALRGMWALIHGFVMLEINGQFQRGGDIESEFFRSVEAYVEGWMTGG